MKRVAIIQDSLTHVGGAEKVFLLFLSMYPEADIYIGISNNKLSNLMKKKIRGAFFTSLLTKFDFSERWLSYFKPLIYMYWKTLKLSNYDLVITSSHSFSSKSVRVPKKCFHVSFIHTPPRYLYEERNELLWIKKFPWSILLFIPLQLIRWLDYIDAQKPHVLVAPSNTVQSRIKKYYDRDSIVVHPPCSFPKNYIKKEGEYFLTVSRLVKQKGTELAIKACIILREKLIVIGKGPEESFLRRISNKFIFFKGFASNTELALYYQRAKALIYCSHEEDFGMVPIEALAHGVPVLAFGSGGVSETVINGKNGFLFREYSVDDLIEIIKSFSKTKINPAVCQKSVRDFTKEKFIRVFSKITSNKKNIEDIM